MWKILKRTTKISVRWHLKSGWENMQSEFVVRGREYQTLIWNFMQSEHESMGKNLLETNKFASHWNREVLYKWNMGSQYYLETAYYQYQSKKKKNWFLQALRNTMTTICIKCSFCVKRSILNNKHSVLFWLFNTFVA